MASQALQAHNDARAKAPGGARPSLQWDNGLANDAQNYANQLARLGKMEHSKDRNGQGENLYASTGTPSFADAAKSWIDEGPLYKGEKIGQIANFGAVGHYTQCVWPETTKLGMGIAKGSNGWTYIVGRYSPAGNMSGQSAWRPGPSGPSNSNNNNNNNNGGNNNNNAPKKGGFYLVNGYKNGQGRSGIAWYNSLGGNDGKQPDKYMDIKKDGLLTWEGTSVDATFGDGTRIVSKVNSNDQVQKAQLFTKVGEATVSGRKIDVKKDKIRTLYMNDGWDFKCIYWAD
ncbi:CAP domain-containing protein [Cercophora newfieldiana]|uniref:CAP domain-containing protein n=1 Tax=Cercophora newfieldiana TaxID=92897 RepID=A0AA39XTT7_9PEZI|nr:CAP domain-containing protein [Cercophora newfieldiana]